MNIQEKLHSSLGNAKEYVALAKVESSVYQKTNIEIIDYLTQKTNTPGVYVALNKPYANILKLLKEKNINTDMVVFIDAVTKTSGGAIEKTKNCLYIGNPENLSDISMAMDQAVRAIPSKDKFLFFDSLNTLLLYNKPITVAKFIHFLSGKMRIWKVKGIIISLQKESNKELLDELSQFCDVIVDI